MIIFKKHIYFFILFISINSFAQQIKIQNISVDDGLPSNIIYDITQDEIGYLWIATKKGLVKYDGKDFTQINKQKSTNLYIKNNVIYAGLENGLLIKKNSEEHFFTSKKVLKIFSFDAKIFVGTTQGIYQLKENNLQPVKINSTIDFSIINDIIFNKKSFYIASNKGLWKLDNLSKPKNSSKILEENSVSLVEFQDEIIVATKNNGLFIVDENQIKKNIQTLEDISSIKKLKNEIWVTSKTNGIEVFVLPSFSFKQKINKYNSLATNSINNTFRDKQNTIYIASDKGIYKLRNENNAVSNLKMPIVYFESLMVNNQNLDSLLASNNSLKFSPSENNISIQFKTVDVLQPRTIQYRFKLNSTFSAWSTNNLVQFANLNPGKYKFQVQAKNTKYESNIKTLSFNIDAPFYKKAWFNFTVIIAILFIAYFSLDYYLKTIHKKHKEKVDKLKLQNHLLSLEQKALQLQMNPHFIFNVLNGIKALGNSGKIDELNIIISKFSVLLRGILNNSRKEEITLKEEIELLKNYIELEQRMSSKSFIYNIDTNLSNIDADEILIPTMLIQPFVENCVQHAFQNNTKGTILINFDVNHGFLNCSILDNGIGINTSKKINKNSNHKSVALDVSKERLKTISHKSSFSIKEIIEENSVKGTKVSFKIPLKTDF